MVADQAPNPLCSRPNASSMFANHWVQMLFFFVDPVATLSYSSGLDCYFIHCTLTLTNTRLQINELLLACVVLCRIFQEETNMSNYIYFFYDKIYCKRQFWFPMCVLCLHFFSFFSLTFWRIVFIFTKVLYPELNHMHSVVSLTFCQWT